MNISKKTANAPRILIKYLKSLEPLERFKEIVSIIHHEQDDDVLRAKLTAIFDTFDLAITKELWNKCQGDKKRCIEIIIENRRIFSSCNINNI